MKKLVGLPIFSLMLSLAGGTAYADALLGDSAHGQELFEHHCVACHSLTTNRVGPVLGGVYGRKAGTATAFNYSTAVQSSNIIWDASTLDQWLTSPQKLVPGQRMNFSISDGQKRADIIAYLKTTSGPPSSAQ
jgi:cytochrome c